MAMQEELNQFISNDVWELVPNPMDMTIIGTKWVYRNKLDKNDVVSRNKARLVAQGYNQQERINYDETYAPVARLESIRILLAYACVLDFNEEVYVAQPPGFIDFAKPNHVYRLKKALYGLKQAPKAWTQSTAIPNVPLHWGIGTIGAGGSPRCQEAMGGSIAQTRSERVPKPPCDSPLSRAHTLGSDEGSMTLQELTVLCTTLSKKVESLEADLKQKKKVYGAAYTKLIKNVKKLEKTVKGFFQTGEDDRRIDQDTEVTLVTPTHSQENQLEDQLGVFSTAKVLADAAKENVYTYTRRRRAVSTGSGEISTASRLFSNAKESISTAGASMPVSTAGMVQEVNISISSPVVIKYKGKGKMEESEDEQIKRTKLQQEQDRLGHEAAVRLQEELDEEERQRMARVHEAAQSFTEEEWENIQARVEADQELSRRLQVEERNKYNEVDQAKMLLAAGSSQATIIDSTKVGSSKRDAEAKLDHEGSKRQKTNEASRSVQEQPEEEEKEFSQEDLQQMMMVVPVEEVYVEALQANHKFRGGLLGIKLIHLVLLSQRLSTAQRLQVLKDRGRGGDFILEVIEACLSSDSIPPGIDDADFDPEGDIRLLVKLLNDDPSSHLPPKELNFEELKTIKSSIDDPSELELKDLPSYLEYAFLEETDKLPVIISKKLKD
ncbi:reverse transcriptase domain, reverse transcriptase zinc-binding domain protein [Tanacetum coccineum]